MTIFNNALFLRVNSIDNIGTAAVSSFKNMSIYRSVFNSRVKRRQTTVICTDRCAGERISFLKSECHQIRIAAVHRRLAKFGKD